MLKDILYTGLGMGVVLKEKVQNEIQKLEDEGKLKKDDAASLLESLSNKGQEEEKRVKELLKSSIKEVIDELGLATKADIEALKKDAKSKK
jgi:polyhydroxyalkanoate synthesis regulator phasin